MMALREILQRTGMLTGTHSATPTPADDAVPTAPQPVSQSDQPVAVSPGHQRQRSAQVPQASGNISTVTPAASNKHDNTLVEG